MPSFKCSDIGVACSFKAEAATEAELINKVAKHASEAHGMDKIPSDLLAKIKQAFKK